MLTLVKTELRAMTKQRLTRMMNDTLRLRDLPLTEIRAGYEAIEAIRDALSSMLDKADGKS